MNNLKVTRTSVRGIERKVEETIEKYGLFKKSDKIVVALSGGKDSTSVLYILHKLGYDVQGLLIDLYLGEWSKIHNEKMTRFCSELGVGLTIVDLKKELGQGICFIKAVLKKQKNLTGCSVCGTVKRWILNKWARELGADKLVTGHNLDDEAQNVLMNFLKGNLMIGANAGPVTGEMTNSQETRKLVMGGDLYSPNSRSRDSRAPPRDLQLREFLICAKANRSPTPPRGNEAESNKGEGSIISKGFIQRVKPLFFVPEAEVLKYAKAKKFDILYEKCPCAFGTYRVETRGWMKGISDADKKKIVEGFLKIVPKIRGESREIRKCVGCGEPSRGELCNACKIFECLK